MHRGQKLELSLWRSGLFSWVPLGGTGLVPRSVWLISSGYRLKTDMNAKKRSQNRTEQNLVRTRGIGLIHRSIIYTYVLLLYHLLFFLLLAEPMYSPAAGPTIISCMCVCTVVVLQLTAQHGVAWCGECVCCTAAAGCCCCFFSSPCCIVIIRMSR